LAVFLSSAQATIKIEIAEVQNGAAYVKGNGAQKGAQITWDGNAVTTANNQNGGFSFNGAVPHDCIGELSDGVSTINVQVLDCTPVSAAPAPVPKTGVTTSYATGDDGALQKGVAWPNPRFTDNGNGTITDNLTGLIWLKNANCIGSSYPELSEGYGPGPVIWQHALDFVAGINAGTYNCGDTSKGGAHQTDWRLPNVRELSSLLDYAFCNGTNFPTPCPAGNNPAIPNTAGTGQGADNDPFSNFVASDYCSSTTAAGDSNIAWLVDFGVGFGGGGVYWINKTADRCFVTAVRGGL
jgi:hypothetical protein